MVNKDVYNKTILLADASDSKHRISLHQWVTGGMFVPIGVGDGGGQGAVAPKIRETIFFGQISCKIRSFC